MTDEMNETEEQREGDRSTSAKLYSTLWRNAHRKRKYTDTSDAALENSERSICCSADVAMRTFSNTGVCYYVTMYFSALRALPCLPRTVRYLARLSLQFL